MSFTKLMERLTRLDRRENRRNFVDRFWSMNKVILDYEQMPQPHRQLFKGIIAIGQFSDSILYPAACEELEKAELAFSGVSDALALGRDHSDLVRQYRSIFAPASVGSPNRGKDNYCPHLFVFGPHADSPISLGIERLNKRDGHLIIPAKQEVLVWSTRVEL